MIQQAQLLEETEDQKKILDVLEEFIAPFCYFVEDSFNYFYLKQGEMSVSHQASAEQQYREDDSTIQRLEDDEAY